MVGVGGTMRSGFFRSSGLESEQALGLVGSSGPHQHEAGPVVIHYSGFFHTKNLCYHNAGGVVNDISDLICPHCGSGEIRYGGGRLLPKSVGLVCDSCGRCCLKDDAIHEAQRQARIAAEVRAQNPTLPFD